MAYKRPPEGKQKLTKKQERLARAVVKDPGASLRDLGKRAGYMGNAVNNPHVVFKTLHLPHVKARIRELMDMSPKLQIPGLLTKLEEGLNATETRFFAHQGEVVSTRKTIDYATRRAYLDTALELHGAKERADGGTTNNFFTREAIEAFVDAFKRKMTNGDHT